MREARRIHSYELVLMTCGFVACGVDTKAQTTGAGGTPNFAGSGGTSSGGSNLAGAGGTSNSNLAGMSGSAGQTRHTPPAESCKRGSEECEACATGRCVPEQVACSSDAACTQGLDKLEACLTCNKCDGACFSVFAAINAQAKAVTDCIDQQCMEACGEAKGGSTETLNQNALGTCKSDSDACNTCLAKQCTTQSDACFSVEVCQRAVIDIGVCLSCNKCDKSCFDTSNAQAQAMNDCLTKNCAAECL
jgi:hypothetical protein